MTHAATVTWRTLVTDDLRGHIHQALLPHGTMYVYRSAVSEEVIFVPLTPAAQNVVEAARAFCSPSSAASIDDADAAYERLRKAAADYEREKRGI